MDTHRACMGIGINNLIQMIFNKLNILSLQLHGYFLINAFPRTVFSFREGMLRFAVPLFTLEIQRRTPIK